MALAPQFLEELRSRLSLASIVGRHIRLVRRGREYIGLCPFHKEKTPSFNVVEDKHFYHCFGCGAHGDVVGFTMRMSNLSFREAVEQLAREAGLRIPIDTPEERHRQERAASLYDVCEAACDFFEKQLRAPGAKLALDYLTRRGLDRDSIAHFRLGWAPDSRDALRRALASKFPEQLLVDAGLLKRSERGDTFDFFRGRVMFPISDRSGKIIAFGGRTLGDGKPKYLNSPDTPIFDKGRTLYAHHLARTSKSDWPAIVAEGYMDVIALHVAGFTRTIAPLGTALTEYQLLEVWKLSSDPIICFDGDLAGQRAADRALDRALPLLRPEFSLRFAILPEKHDPDSLIRNRGVKALATCLRSALSISEFLWRITTDGNKDTFFDTPEKILRLQNRFGNKIKKIDNHSVQKEYRLFLFDKISELRQRHRRLRFIAKISTEASPDFRSRSVLASGADARQRNIEILIIAFAINHPEIVQNEQIDWLSNLDFADKELAALWQVLLEKLGDNSRVDSADLQLAISERQLGAALDRVLGSEAVRGAGYVHYGKERESAEAGWKAIVAKSRLPKLEAEREAALMRYSADMTDDNWATLMMYRGLVADHLTESDFSERPWPADQGQIHPPTIH